MTITCSTRLYGSIGAPIKQVKAPSVFSTKFSEKNVEAIMVPVHASAKELKQVIDGLKAVQNFDGLIVTIPHKQTILEFCDWLEPAAEKIEAVNSIYFNSDRKLVGNNFDGSGFVTSLIGYNHIIRDRTIALFGAGGAARSLAFSLAEAGAGRLVIINRTVGKSKLLPEKLQKLYVNQEIAFASPGQMDLNTAEIAINATSLGLNKEDPLPFNPAETGENCLIAEINVVPETTSLLERALSLGRRVHYGAPMVEYQIPMHSEFLKMW